MAASGCATVPATEVERRILVEDAEVTVELFRLGDPGMKEFFDTAYGYAVFPDVGKGAVGVGGAYGRGVVYEQGKHIGYCDLTQGTVGLQLGGQAYREIIFFERKSALDRFRVGDLVFAAQVSAVAANAGASADADYSNGVVVFTMARGGLMAEASVGGQQFRYEAR